MRAFLIGVTLFVSFVFLILSIYRYDAGKSGFSIDFGEIPKNVSKIEIYEDVTGIALIELKKPVVNKIEISDGKVNGLLFRVFYDDGVVVESTMKIIKPGMTMVLEFDSDKKLYCRLINANLL